ncbi:MAG: L-glutamate gamma-semialdehyde dehydrogenase [Prevotellaceae bacterium]|jgi:1-pyrroline-5-carboxylate dehydrogenase|nr:L-glutamate gamma-semialdehyde dehydrogenase [Prevotellaceae bacterium]
MNNAIFSFKQPINEPIYGYLEGSKERQLILAEVEKQKNQQIEIPLIIGGKEIKTGKLGKVVMPHDHQHVLASYHMVGEKEVQMAIDAAMAAKEAWSSLPWVERASIMMRAAEFISKKYRYVLNAATMLGQSKNIFQAEIDSACEIADFLRFNVHYASQIYAEQPMSSSDVINRVEHRALEGFVYAITPFNFTAIAGNLNMAPVLMGNVTVWKPATTAILSNYYLMKVFQEAGVPDGVINFLPGQGSVISGIVMKDKNFAGIHFTGSNNTFNSFWRQVAENLPTYRSYPRIVGETGGKDFIFAHKSADIDVLTTAIVRGAFEYQGQKCSAASRAYLPQSLWNVLKDKFVAMVGRIKMGDPTDPKNLMGAVIDEKSFDNIMTYVEDAKKSSDAEVIVGGNGDKSKGYFIEPTIILCKDPKYVTMQEELFGPVISIYVYEDDKYEETLKLCDETSIYALTGSIFSSCRYAAMKAFDALRYSAGNFYINDKPTGAVVGQQPFGGARGSGTNDKAGGWQNLIRWVNPRTIKETLVPPTDFPYPYME